MADTTEAEFTGERLAKSGQAFPIVGVGASAGGVEALEGFFKGLPDKPNLAVVVVTHLNPERKSVLHEIIARHTKMAVEVATDGVEVLPNHVYVLPADATIGITDGHLRIGKPGPGERQRKPVDIFFSALAKDRKEYAASVVLSGGDGDGTLGTKAIKERGGLTLAQTANGHGPSYPSMPDSAISTGDIDLAIPAEQMGPELVKFAHNLDMLDGVENFSRKLVSDPDWKAACEAIYAILRNQAGHDFSGYKPKTFTRRVHRRMQVTKVDDVTDYVERLRADPKEVNALFRDLLINVTNFFRDVHAFESLTEHVIPSLLDGKGASDTIRIWIPGCSTGEEVFSIAMLMREALDAVKNGPRVQIFATDIDERALAVARAGCYPDALLDGLSQTRRDRFFSQSAGIFVISRQIRDMCVFSPHSVFRDPPFSRVDLVSCRNLLIYFGPDIQGQVIPIFHYALQPRGYLFLGTSENIGQYTDLFVPVDKKQRIFQRRDDIASSARLPLRVSALKRLPKGTPRDANATLDKAALRQAVETQVIDRFAPAHVVATRDGDILYYSARTGRYLEAAVGSPTRQLLTLARRGLRLDLRALLRAAGDQDKSVIRESVPVEGDDGRVRFVTLTVEPLNERSGDEALFLVLFADQPIAAVSDASIGSNSDGNAEHLELELRDTRERLQSLIEEYETAIEELKSSNEELMSVNEEHQSTNEELEASKEEHQSVNEELHTVNAELSGKVDALDRANSDLQNLFESTQVATIFLDMKLTIRSFTPTVTQFFSILQSDRGRPITDFASQLPLPDLVQDLRAVLDKSTLVERQVDLGDRHYLVRISPYHGSLQVIQGVVITFVDVTTLTQAEAHQQILIAELNHRVKNMLMVAITVAERTWESAASPEAFKTAFVERLRAMARSYELLSRENWIEASIDELIRNELTPFGAESFSMAGPNLKLRPRQALSTGLVLHELVTNASKYGALSVSEGRVSVIWTKIPGKSGDDVEIVWRETGGLHLGRPDKAGFGLTLVERETSYNLGGSADIAFDKTGVTVTLRFPLENDDVL